MPIANSWEGQTEASLWNFPGLKPGEKREDEETPCQERLRRGKTLCLRRLEDRDG